MEFILQSANDYALKHSSKTDELLGEIHALTVQEHPEAHMLSGPLQGIFLTMISKMIKPKRILEIGTFVGYSALCLAKGLDTGGVLHTIEKREQDAERSKQYIDRSSHRNNIIVHVGDASAIIETLEEDWDLIFIDADKTGYLSYYQQLIDKVRSGTWFIIDNVLFHGEVLKEKITGKNAKAITDFNEYIKEDDRVEKVMLTIRDGITLMYKK
ncbi:MAG: O-methyltransferase [bacterium]|jgi:caffeoyl-CoA O-methyltransferase